MQFAGNPPKAAVRASLSQFPSFSVAAFVAVSRLRLFFRDRKRCILRGDVGVWRKAFPEFNSVPSFVCAFSVAKRHRGGRLESDIRPFQKIATEEQRNLEERGWFLAEKAGEKNKAYSEEETRGVLYRPFLVLRRTIFRYPLREASLSVSSASPLLFLTLSRPASVGPIAHLTPLSRF